MKKLKAVTMSDVAREAGVTAATVSLVLSRNPAISPTTRDRVRSAVERLGYTLDPYLHALMTSRRHRAVSSRSPVLIFLAPRGQPGDFASLYFAGASDRAAAKGFRLEAFSVDPADMPWRRVEEIFYTRGIEGLLLAPWPEDHEAPALDWNLFSVVGCGTSPKGIAVNRVTSDQFQSALMALQLCREHGYRRCGLVLTERSNRRGDERATAAYWLHASRLNPASRIAPLIVDAWDDKCLHGWLEQWGPDVILTPDATMVREGLERLGWSVTEDVSLVALETSELDDAISGVYADLPRLGARAIDLLVGAIRRNERGLAECPESLMIDGAWTEGTTMSGHRHPGGEVLQSFQRAPSAAKSPTMRDLARQLGLDPSTISRGLKNSPSISQKTRVAILEAAERLGYRPNPYVSLLMQNRRRSTCPLERPVVGFGTAFSTPGGWREVSAMFPRLFEGAAARAEARGFQLQEYWVGSSRAGEHAERLKALNIRGVIFAPLPQAETTLDFAWDEFCHVGIGFTLASPAIHRVANDQFSSMRRVFAECTRHGYRRLGLTMRTSTSTRVQDRWLAAFLLLQRAHPQLEAIPPLVVEPWRPVDVQAWFERERPDVIISPIPQVILRWLGTWGYSCPGDVGLVSLNCGNPTDWFAGAYQNAFLLGARAMDILIGLIERNETGVSSYPNTLLIDSIWNPGMSLKPLAAKKSLIP
jgi:DNA-binding LacI/PurR family transcriptional regulator